MLTGVGPENHVFYGVFGVAVFRKEARAAVTVHKGDHRDDSNQHRNGSPRHAPFPSFALLPSPAGARLSGVSL